MIFLDSKSDSALDMHESLRASSRDSKKRSRGLPYNAENSCNYVS